jgi:anti-sigma B factor antagonist
MTATAVRLPVCAEDSEPMGLTLNIMSSAGHWLVAADGILDTATAPQLRRTLADIRRRGNVKVAVDLSGIRFIDAAGLSVLAAASRYCQLEGLQLQLRDPSRTVWRLIRLLNLSKAFDIRSGAECRVSR